MNTQDIKKLFPQLKIKVYGNKWTYLDNAATTLKPQSVIDRITKFYSNEVSNVHRGAHFVSDQATESYEKARGTLAQFVGSDKPSEIIFTKGTTESCNLVAGCFSEKLKPGDEIILSQMEHHSNIVPWQRLAQKTGAKIHYIPVNEDKELCFKTFKSLLNERTQLVCLVYVSNSVGTTNPIEKFFNEAKKFKARTVLDAAQAGSLYKLDIKGLSCDFMCLSAHKLFGPFGIGILWAKEDLLNELPPYQTGGSMIDSVEESGTSFLKAPFRFEAGTPNVCGAVAFKEAIDFLTAQSFEKIRNHEKSLVEKTVHELKKYPQVTILNHKDSLNVVSFVVDGVHPLDLGQLLDQQGIATRTGHHCTQPLMKKMKVSGTVRISFALYNDEEDVNYFLKAFDKSYKMLL